GYVAFSSKGDRIAWTQVEQMIDGNYTLLGYYDTQTDNLTWLKKEKWTDGKPPPDRTIIKKVLRTVTLSLFISMTAVSGLGILWALGLLIFNTIFRHSRYIALSHPMCNNIMLVGIICCLLCACLLGLDGQFVGEASFNHLCQVRTTSQFFFTISAPGQ
ncbi:Gamma-aminobutyric acid type B receptor subunit 1, partial [Araneus ventricosus]